MSEKMDRKAFHTAIDTTLSGLQENPFLYQRVIAQESRKDGIIVKKRLSVGRVMRMETSWRTAIPKPEFLSKILFGLGTNNDEGRRYGRFDHTCGLIAPRV